LTISLRQVGELYAKITPPNMVPINKNHDQEKIRKGTRVGTDRVANNQVSEK